MTSKRPNNSIEALLDLSAFGPASGIAVLPIAQKRVAQIKEPMIELEDGVKVAKGCAKTVLAVFRAHDAATVGEFTSLLMFEKPQKVKLPHSSTADKASLPLFRLLADISYQRGNPGWDQGVHDIIDQCVELTTDNTLIFNEALLLKHFDPLERKDIDRQARQYQQASLSSLTPAHP